MVFLAFFKKIVVRKHLFAVLTYITILLYLQLDSPTHIKITKIN